MIHKWYRQLLKRPALRAGKIESMRKHMIRLAQTIGGHFWGKKFD
jgi:hypothetical protein